MSRRKPERLLARLHFGLADDARYDRIEIAWPGGEREAFPGGAANQVVTLKQGGGTVVRARGGR